MSIQRGLWLALVVATSARAGIIEWVPVSSSGPHSITGNNQITLEAGGGVSVTLQLMISDWDRDMDGDPLLGAFQATLDATSLLGSSAVPKKPGANLLPSGWPDQPHIGAYQATEVCFNGALDGEPCSASGDPPSYTPAECQAAGGLPVCAPNVYFVFNGIDYIESVRTTSLNDFSWGATMGPNANAGKEDTGDSLYGGTLVLEIPDGANSTYTVRSRPQPSLSFLNDDGAVVIPAPILIPAVIVVEGGPCCETLSEYAHFQNCFTGDEFAPIPQVCNRFDFPPADNQIDYDDLEQFQTLFVGP